MQNPRLATRYAKSLLDMAVEQNQLEVTLADINMLDRVVASSREFAVVLRSPVIKADKKIAIVNALIGSRMAPLTKAFVDLLITKGREGGLPEIAQAFISQYKLMHRIKSVKLSTATPVNDSVKESIRKKLEAAMPDQKIEITEEIKPELIGGFVLQMDDKLFDASIRRDLNDIKAQFMQNLYVSQLA